MKRLGYLGLDIGGKDGNNPLHLAATAGYLQVIRAMFPRGKMDTRNGEDLDVFALALRGGNKCLKLIQFLIKKELCSLKSRYGTAKRTPLHYAVLNSEWFVGIV